MNHPLKVDGVKVFLLGNGYAPVFTVRDKDGEVVSRGPVPFLPRDGNNTSTGVVKVTGHLAADRLRRSLPADRGDRRERSASRSTRGSRCRARCSASTGATSASTAGRRSRSTPCRQDGLTQVRGENGRKLVVGLAPGTSVTLPTGETITMDGVRRWASLQVARDPGTGPALGAALLALAGLMASLFVRRRRVWVGSSGADGGRTLVEVAGLARTEGEGGDGLADELRELLAEIGSDDGTGAARDV